MTNESNYRICKGPCGQMKLRKFLAKFPDGKNKIWVDETGKRWNGSKCHDCENERLKTVMKNKTKKDFDPTPYCSGCKVMKKEDCKCGPIVENE